MTESFYVCISCKKPIIFGVNYCPVCGAQQHTGTAPLWLGERRLVTILFADLASFTATSENADPEDIIDMLNQVFARLMLECDREGGYLDKTVGDQLMVLFGAPRTHEDDPARAVRAALGMQDAMEELAPVLREKVGVACKLNIGIHTGIVVWGRMGPRGRQAPTVIGDAVNLACRLEQFATGGQIIVSDAIYFQTRRFFEYEVLDPVRVKGKSKPIPIYMPLHARQSLRSQNQSTEMKSPFLERDQELQALHAYWSRTIAGQGQFVLISGDAGMGKSRLLVEFIKGVNSYSASKRPLLLQTNAETATVGNYAPIPELLSQLFNLTDEDTDLSRRSKVDDRAQMLGITNKNFLPLIGYLLGWYGDDDRLAGTGHNLSYLRKSAFDAAAALIFKQSTRRPTLLIIDDLQWAEASTLLWLNMLATLAQTIQQERAEHKLMLLVASRPQAEVPLESLITDTVLALPPLSDMGRRELITNLLPGEGVPITLVERLSHESGGNPFYLEEATRELVQSEQLVRQNGIWQLTCSVDQIYVPHSVEGLVMAHMDILDPSTRIVLQHASVIGLRFGYKLLSAITPVEDINQSLKDLEQRGFIRKVVDSDSDRFFIFTQMIMREVAYRSLLRKTRRDLHDQIAQLTETEASVTNEDELETLAHHYASGNNDEKVIVYNWLAGRRALDQFEYEEAYRYLEHAWIALTKLTEPDRQIYWNVANALGDASVFTGNSTQAANCYRVVQELADGNSDESAMYHYKIGRLHLYQSNIEAAHQNYHEALKLSTTNPLLTAQIHAELRLLQDLS